MKSRIEPTSPELSRAMGTYATFVDGEVEAKVAEVGRHRDIASQTMEASHLASEWRALNEKRLGDESAMLALLDQIAPTNARVLDSLSGRAKALQGVASSFLGLSEVLSQQRTGIVTLGTARRHEQTQQQVLKRIDQINRALDAAADSDAAKIFPKAQLDEIARQARERIGQIHEVADSRCRRSALDKSVRLDEVKKPKDAARVIADRLGDASLEQLLIAAHGKLGSAEKKSFADNMSAIALLADEAVNAPDYQKTRMGWHHPNARSAYRLRSHDAISRYQSQDRQDESRRRLGADLQVALRSARPDRALEKLLVESFVREIGAPDLKGNAAAVRRALEHEAFVPLRGLNETVKDMSPDRSLTGEFEKAVRNITEHIVKGDYREWRYDNPISALQLSGMTALQKEKWKDDLRTSYKAGGLKLKTREEDDIELLWLTKIGGPSHGFDYGGRCLLPLLSNGRTKAILVDDERWPHNAAARSYIRVLHLPDGSPTLYLEPFQRDFPHRQMFEQQEIDAHLYAAVISHAKKKADELGLPLSIGEGYRELVEALKIPATLVEKSLGLKASNGVFEASDTLGLGHDFPQQQDMTTPPLRRLEYLPKVR